MAKYKVRDGFVCWVPKEVSGKIIEQNYTAGEELELTEEQFEKVAHQVEPVTSKRTTRSTKEDTE